MLVNSNQPHLTPEEYLEAEKSSLIKHEYIQGQVYAMTGASDAHVTIVINIAFALKNHLRGSHCRLYTNDMKARIESLNIFYYPDVMVTCDPKDRTQNYYKTHPCLIIEVLSLSTEAFDRGDKFAHYRELDSLQEYVLVSQSKQSVDCFRRNKNGVWCLHSYRDTEQLKLESIDFSCVVSDLYEDVIFPEN